MSIRPTGHVMRSPFVSGLRARPLRGFTLVELLIAMALTLMLVYAVAQFYAYVGETVRDGRAQIEMGNHLRAAQDRLRQDFAELTVRVGGRIDAGSGQGFLEFVEGVASDSDPDGDLAVAPVPYDLVSANVAVDVNNDGKPDSAMLGDCDDILSMTIRSQGDPFVGRQFTGLDANGIPQYAIIQSNLAEVFWFTTFKDANSDGIWQISEPRYLVRRQLLIRPDLVVSWPTAPGALPAGQSIYHHNDISCHVVLNNMGNFAGYVANSLGDLSQRENRCLHQNTTNLNSNGLLAPNYMPNTLQVNVGLTHVPPPTALYPPGSCAFYSLDGIDQFHGEDKMLSNVLAFDIRVYDPFAVLRADNSDLDGSVTPNVPDDNAIGIVSPGDPGYAFAAWNNHPVTGMGAYVDLWYTRAYTNIPVAQRIPILQSCNSAYAWAPSLGAGLNAPAFGAAWDSWSLAYEKDGLAQFGGTADELVDGLDNNNSGGVDDPSEAETRAPYPATIGENGIDEDGDGLVDGNDSPGAPSPPNSFFETFSPPAQTVLRGIEVRIRMYEPGTRQTRQVTVATDFIPE